MKISRVVLWNTGNVGRLALRAILDDPALDLVGVYAFSPDKAGIDAGTLCDRPPTGILATADIDALIAAKPHVVVYTPFTGSVDDVVTLLEHGVNILSTNLFFHVGGVRGAVRERLEAACAKGGSSFYVTGINPGWINSIATALTAICGRVDCVTISETADCANYRSPETWNHFRMGQTGVTPDVLEAAQSWLGMFRDAAERVGEALGIAFDTVAFDCDYATAAETVDLGWFRMEKGTNAAIRAGWNGIVDGQTKVRTEVTWHLTTKLAEGWEVEGDDYHLRVSGAPNIDMRMRFSDPDPSPIDGEWDGSAMTAYAAVNAIAQIRQARPGVLTLHDIGLPAAPAAACTAAGWGKTTPAGSGPA